MPTYLSAALRTQLVTQRVPYELVDGPERLNQGPSVEPHVTLQRDPTGDTWKPAISRVGNNPSYLMTRVIGMQLLIYMQARKASPSTLDHDDQTDSVVKQLAVALYHVFGHGFGTRVEWRFKPSRFLTVAEIDELNLTRWPGRIYLLPFDFDDAILDKDAEGDALPTFEFATGDVVTTITTSGSGSAGGLPSATTELDDS